MTTAANTTRKPGANRTRPRTTAPAADGAATDDTTAPATDDTTAPATDGTTAPATDGGATGGAATDGATAPATDGAAPDGAAPEGAGVVSWEDVVPLIALRVGPRPSRREFQHAAAVWTVLQASPGLTAMHIAATAEVAGSAGIDGKTVSTILSRYQRAGIARSDEGNGVDVWYPGTPQTLVADAESLTAADGSGTGVPGPGAGNGVVAGKVEDFLREHSGTAYGSTKLSQELGHSSGAIAKALDALTAKGTVVLAQESPRRHRIAPDTETAPDTGSAPETGSASESGSES